MRMAPLWLDDETDRKAVSQASRADATKLVTTFTAGIAATLAATALQVGGEPGLWDKWAVALLGATLLLTLSVVISDRMKEVDLSETLNYIKAQGHSDELELAALRAAKLTCVNFNEDVLQRIVALVWIQVVAATLTSAASVASLLGAT